jgi:hypothetical protein
LLREFLALVEVYRGRCLKGEDGEEGGGEGGGEGGVLGRRTSELVELKESVSEGLKRMRWRRKREGGRGGGEEGGREAWMTEPDLVMVREHGGVREEGKGGRKEEEVLAIMLVLPGQYFDGGAEDEMEGEVGREGGREGGR